MIDAKAFLKKNGFNKMEPNHYANDMCGVVFENNGIVVADNAGNQKFGLNDTYWLIGYLTYHNYLPQNYVK